VIFVSFWFVAFVLALLPVYWLARLQPIRLAVLSVGCVIFHFHFAGPAGVIPIIVLGVVTYLAGLTRHGIITVLGMALCVLALLLYKYTHFLAVGVVELLAPGTGQALAAGAQSALPATPPLGISFFVFEFVHYLFDIRHGSEPIRNPLHFGLFSIFWPSLVAGPIKRYQSFIPQLLAGTSSVSKEDAARGLLQVSGGLIKKLAADNLTIWLDFTSPNFATLDLGWRWVFLLVLALRIYWDFSGYSDIAIGYARMMGIGLPRNFNWPYIATSLSDFWSRWHISLSSWIRDYVYIPLGGNRRGLPRRVANGIIAFALVGLWHGADWNFILWGLLHGVGLAISGNYAQILGRPGQVLASFFAHFPAAGGLLTFLFVAFGWLLFFYPASTALQMIRLLVGLR
jgi:alginate O-acetyltransferase complex protein AlgI